MEICLSMQVKMDLFRLEKVHKHSHQTETRVSTRQVLVQF